MSTKKRMFLSIIGVAVCILFVVLLFLVGGKKNVPPDNSEATGSSSTSSGDSVSSEPEKGDDSSTSDSDSETDTKPVPKKDIYRPEDNPNFTELFPADDHSMVGRFAWADLGLGAQDHDAIVEAMGLVKENSTTGPLTTPTGHQLYLANDNKEYILSGYSNPICVINGTITDASTLREELSGQRVFLVPNNSMLETFNRQWDDGQAILSGKAMGKHGDIVLDGALIHHTYTEKDGKIYFNAYDIAKLINDNTHYDEMSGRLNVWTNERNQVSLLTNVVSGYLSEKHNVNYINETYTFTSWYGEPKFEYKASLLDYEDLLISAEDASRMLGWRIFSDGNGVLAIETDPTNLRNTVALYSNGSMGMTAKVETDEDGNKVINTYDDYGNLLSTEPYIEHDLPVEDETSESQAQEKETPSESEQE